MKTNKNFKQRSYKVQEGLWTVFDGLCKGCNLCKVFCPLRAIESSKDHFGIYTTPGVLVNPKKCKLCGFCAQICPDSAIKVEIKI